MYNKIIKKELKMLTPKNNAFYMRTEMLVKVAASYLKDRLATADEIPSEVYADGCVPARGSLERDRDITKFRAMAAMGIDITDEANWSKSLNECGQEALARTQAPLNKIMVIKSACNACKKTQHIVSNQCQGCFARPCQINCPKRAISFVDGKAFIDPSLCINCGICKEACPYHAIIKIALPCEDACPVGAICKDENGIEHIDPAKCISCGQCLASCPFGAIIEESHIIDVLKAMKESGKKVVAMVAPAIIGQFSGTVGNMVGALKKLGFAEVIEVAVGADITTLKESEEFVERMHEGAAFMTTSCCPAYYRAVEKHLNELEPYVSTTRSPMYYTAELVKKENPDCVAVFVGPCLAKREERQRDANPYTDYVITFEEVGAMFTAAGINVTECEEAQFSKMSYAQGRIFPVSGGVASAVSDLVGDQAEIRLEKIDGLTKDSVKVLKRYGTKGGENNLIEIMSCPGGCIGGPGCVNNPKKTARSVENYVKEGQQLTRDSKIGG